MTTPTPTPTPTTETTITTPPTITQAEEDKRDQKKLAQGKTRREKANKENSLLLHAQQI